jgi:hypothetical protein
MSKIKCQAKNPNLCVDPQCTERKAFLSAMSNAATYEEYSAVANEHSKFEARIAAAVMLEGLNARESTPPAAVTGSEEKSVLQESVDVDLGWYSGQAAIEYGEYEDGQPAMTLWNNEGALTTVSVNLSAYGITNFDKDKIIVKDYSENKGLVDSLKRAGMVTEIIEKYSFGHVTDGAILCKLDPKFVK